MPAPKRGPQRRLKFKREGGLLVAESSKRKAMATPTFVKFLRGNYGPVRAFLEARKHIQGVGATYINRGVRVRRLPRGTSTAKLWEVAIGSKKLFVKEESTALHERQHGPGQLVALRRLGEIATKNIEPAKYYLGWKGRNASFLVTEFYDLPRMSEARVPEALTEEFNRMRESAILEGFLDIKKENAFYDKARGKLIVFDAVLRGWGHRKAK